MARTFPTAGVSPIDVYNTQVRPSVYIEHVVTTDSTERHSVELDADPTMISGSNYVNLNITTSPVGTSGAWVTSLFSKITQDSTKRVTGYLCAGEFEVVNSANNQSAMAVLVLNWNNSSNTPGAPGASTNAYIQLRDYSSGTKQCNLFEFTDATIGTLSSTSLLSTDTVATATHSIRFTIANVPYWIMCANSAPA